MGHPSLPHFRPGHRLTASEMETISRLLNRKIRGIDVMSSATGTSIWHRPSRRTGGGGAAIIRFQVLSEAPFMDPSLAFCDAILGKVLDLSCGCSSVSVDDEVIVWDPSTCWFTVPMDLLLGSMGTAVQMAKDGSWPQIEECLEYGALTGDCWWMVTALCCVETIYGG